MYNDLKNSLAFSLIVNESTGIQDKPQLAIFVCYVSVDVIVKEEMLDMVLTETTHSVDIKNVLDKALTNTNVLLDKLVSVSMDGAPAMVGEKVGLMRLLKAIPNFQGFSWFIASSIVNISQSDFRYS
ncbi:unnamed protein product [Caretta caretta]